MPEPFAHSKYRPFGWIFVRVGLSGALPTCRPVATTGEVALPDLTGLSDGYCISLKKS